MNLYTHIATHVTIEQQLDNEQAMNNINAALVSAIGVRESDLEARNDNAQRVIQYNRRADKYHRLVHFVVHLSEELSRE